jgi:hypothetical protein
LTYIAELVASLLSDGLTRALLNELGKEVSSNRLAVNATVGNILVSLAILDIVHAHRRSRDSGAVDVALGGGSDSRGHRSIDDDRVSSRGAVLGVVDDRDGLDSGLLTLSKHATQQAVLSEHTSKQAAQETIATQEAAILLILLRLLLRLLLGFGLFHGHGLLHNNRFLLAVSLGGNGGRGASLGDEAVGGGGISSAIDGSLTVFFSRGCGRAIGAVCRNELVSTIAVGVLRNQFSLAIAVSIDARSTIVGGGAISARDSRVLRAGVLSVRDIVTVLVTRLGRESILRGSASGTRARSLTTSSLIRRNKLIGTIAIDILGDGIRNIIAISVNRRLVATLAASASRASRASSAGSTISSSSAVSARNRSILGARVLCIWNAITVLVARLRSATGDGNVGIFVIRIVLSWDAIAVLVTRLGSAGGGSGRARSDRARSSGGGCGGILISSASTSSRVVTSSLILRDQLIYTVAVDILRNRVGCAIAIGVNRGLVRTIASSIRGCSIFVCSTVASGNRSILRARVFGIGNTVTIFVSRLRRSSTGGGSVGSSFIFRNDLILAITVDVLSNEIATTGGGIVTAGTIGVGNVRVFIVRVGLSWYTVAVLVARSTGTVGVGNTGVFIARILLWRNTIAILVVGASTGRVGNTGVCVVRVVLCRYTVAVLVAGSHGTVRVGNAGVLIIGVVLSWNTIAILVARAARSCRVFTGGGGIVTSLIGRHKLVNTIAVNVFGDCIRYTIAISVDLSFVAIGAGNRRIFVAWVFFIRSAVAIFVARCGHEAILTFRTGGILIRLVFGNQFVNAVAVNVFRNSIRLAITIGIDCIFVASSRVRCGILIAVVGGCRSSGVDGHIDSDSRDNNLSSSWALIGISDVVFPGSSSTHSVDGCAIDVRSRRAARSWGQVVVRRSPLLVVS